MYERTAYEAHNPFGARPAMNETTRTCPRCGQVTTFHFTLDRRDEILSKWRVWERGGQFVLAHAIDGDGPTRAEWEELASIWAPTTPLPRIVPPSGRDGQATP